MLALIDLNACGAGLNAANLSRQREAGKNDKRTCDRQTRLPIIAARAADMVLNDVKDTMTPGKKDTQSSTY